MNSNFTVIGLTRLRIKPESTDLEAEAISTRQSELLNLAKNRTYDFESNYGPSDELCNSDKLHVSK